MRTPRPRTSGRTAASPIGTGPAISPPRPRPAPAEPGFQPIRTRRIFEQICSSVRERLICGALKPGDRLPPERALAEQFAVSRAAVREALRSLEIAGIVILRNGRNGGAFITESGAGQVTRSFQDMLDFGRVSLSMLLEARLLVMDVVVRAASERIGPADLARLEENIAETVALTAAGNHDARTLKAVEFSTLLADATGNPVLSAMIEAMASVIRAFVVLAGPPPHDPLVASRRRLVAQLANGEAAAACDTMRLYLTSLNDHLLQTERDRLRPSPQPQRRARPPRTAKV